MTLRFIPILIIVSFLPIEGKSQDTIFVHTFAGFHLGGTYNQGLDKFNQDLLANSVTQVPDLNFSWGFDYTILLGKSCLDFNLIGQSINNKSEAPNTRILMNTFGITANYGYDLIFKNENVRFEPYLGVGVSTIELFITSHDSSATFNQVANGAQNLYYERSGLGILLDGGIRFSFFPKKKDFKIAYFGQANYQYQLNQHTWKLQDMSLSRLSKLSIMVGMKLNLPKPRKWPSTK